MTVGTDNCQIAQLSSHSADNVLQGLEMMDMRETSTELSINFLEVKAAARYFTAEPASWMPLPSILQLAIAKLALAEAMGDHPSPQFAFQRIYRIVQRGV